MTARSRAAPEEDDVARSSAGHGRPGGAWSRGGWAFLHLRGSRACRAMASRRALSSAPPLYPRLRRPPTQRFRALQAAPPTQVPLAQQLRVHVTGRASIYDHANPDPQLVGYRVDSKLWPDLDGRSVIVASEVHPLPGD